MIAGGYVLQPRCFDKSESAHLPPVTRELWLYLLRRVNHKDNGKFKRGQGFFSLDDIQKDLSWMVGYRRVMYSKPQLTKSLRRLREGNMVETTKETRGVMVTICKYSFYQDPKNYEGNGEETVNEERKESGDSTKNKNDKNVKNGKKKDIYTDDQKAIAASLIRIVSLKRELKITPSQELMWFNNIRLMETKDGIPVEKMVPVLEWYEKNWMNQYVPVVESACAFREKWPKLLNAIDRDKKPAKKDNHNGFDQRDYAKDATPDSEIPEFLR